MNHKLQTAKNNKKDEFYTQYKDVENELKHYHSQFKGKTIYCNTDGMSSDFVQYFIDHYHQLELKGLYATRYRENGHGSLTVYNGDRAIVSPMNGDGSYDSEESLEVLKKCDIVVTNPPFSLFRDYIDTLIESGKKFLVMGNINAITYKNIFPLIKENKMWFGYSANKTIEFMVDEDYTFTNPNNGRVDENGIKYLWVNGITWYTNLNVDKRNEYIPLKASLKTGVYPEYDNYDAIEVSRVADIPMDYDGIMGVPITFLTRYNPNQFEILGSRRWSKSELLLDHYRGSVEPPENDKKTTINGKETYDRIFIRRVG